MPAGTTASSSALSRKRRTQSRSDRSVPVETVREEHRRALEELYQRLEARAAFITRERTWWTCCPSPRWNGPCSGRASKGCLRRPRRRSALLGPGGGMNGQEEEHRTEEHRAVAGIRSQVSMFSIPAATEAVPGCSAWRRRESNPPPASSGKSAWSGAATACALGVQRSAQAWARSTGHNSDLGARIGVFLVRTAPAGSGHSPSANTAASQVGQRLGGFTVSVASRPHGRLCHGVLLRSSTFPRQASS